VDCFFAEQFSFWTVGDNHYHQLLIAPIGGVERKGSDYLWAAIARWPEVDAEFCCSKAAGESESGGASGGLSGGQW
jgi:hypothetical protein